MSYTCTLAAEAVQLKIAFAASAKLDKSVGRKNAKSHMCTSMVQQVIQEIFRFIFLQISQEERKFDHTDQLEFSNIYLLIFFHKM